MINNRLSAPTEVQWEITDKCNHRCIHCYNYWRNTTLKNDVLSTKDRLRFYYKTTQEIIDNKIFRVVITGGEPLIFFWDILPFLYKLKKAGVILFLNSNLTLLTPQIAEEIKRLNMGALVSVTGPNNRIVAEITQSKEAFVKTEKGIKLAMKYGIMPTANMVVTKRNLAYIYETAKYVKMIGLRRFGATKACRPVNCLDFSTLKLSIKETRKIFETLIKINQKLALDVDSFIGYPLCLFNNQKAFNLLSKRVCLAGRETCSIGYNGEIRPCSHISKTYGSITNGLKSTWKKMNDWRVGKFIPKKCGTCILKETCFGGCRVEAFTHLGKFDAVDPYADYNNNVKQYFNNVMSKPINNSLKFKKLIVNNLLRFRKEKLGWLVYYSFATLISNDLFELLSNKLGKQITVQDIANKLKVTEKEALPTVDYLWASGIVIEKNRFKMNRGSCV